MSQQELKNSKGIQIYLDTIKQGNKDIKVIVKKVDLRIYKNSFEKEAFLMNMLQTAETGFSQLVRMVVTDSQGELYQSYVGDDLASLDLFQSGSHESKVEMLRMAKQILGSLEHIHGLGYTHGDIKYDNICRLDIGRGDEAKTEYSLIDFDLATNYHDAKKLDYFTGNTYFSSRAGIKLQKLMPKDDIESLLNLICYQLNDFTLPWFTDIETQTSNDIFRDRRKNDAEYFQTMIKQLPSNIANCYKYLDNLREGVKPNYEFLRATLQKEIERMEGKTAMEMMEFLKYQTSKKSDFNTETGSISDSTSQSSAPDFEDEFDEGPMFQKKDIHFRPLKMCCLNVKESMGEYF